MGDLSAITKVGTDLSIAIQIYDVYNRTNVPTVQLVTLFEIGNLMTAYAPLLIGLLASTITGAADDTCTNPTSRPKDAGAEAFMDSPAARNSWFVRGRSEAGGGLAAAA